MVRAPGVNTAGPSVIIPTWRDSERAIALVAALRDAWRCDSDVDLVVVDDGSADGSDERLQSALDGVAGVRVLALPANVGRSSARNAGAEAANGEWLLFLDADCLPADPDWINAHRRCHVPGVVASTGPVLGTGRGFWSEYQARASARRARQHAAGMAYSGAGSNLAVRRSDFIACGGFDPAYRNYGFEDRDLLLRLLKRGNVAWAQEAVVRHMDTLSLASVCHKMREAGGEPARLFDHRHPDAYRRLGYARLDLRHHPNLRWPARWIEPLLAPAARWLEPTLDWRWLPFGLRAGAAKLVAGLHFMVGTRPPEQRGSAPVQ